MSHDSRRKRTPAPAVPPPIPKVEASWDDETQKLPRNPLLEDEEAFDRVTAIPDVPFERYAKEVMAEAENAEASGLRGAELPETEPPPDSIPPVLGGLFGRSESPSAPETRRFSPQELAPLVAANIPSAPAQAALPRANSQERRAIPGASEPTGIELSLDIDIDIHSTAPPPVAPETWSDPRDPDLELDLGALEPAQKPQSAARLQPLKDRFAMGDFSGALEIAERLLEANPDDLDAQRYANRCRDTLVQMFTARLGALDRIVSVAVPPDQIRWLSLDHRAGFLLSLIDGTSSVEQMLDISGMPRLDALRILHALLEQRVIALRQR